MPITKGPSAPTRKSPASSQAAPQGEVVFTPRDKDREAGLTGVAQTVSMLLVMRSQFADAGAIGIHGPGLIKETVKLAKANEPVGKVLDLLAQAGPYSGIIFAAMPLVAQIAVNHGRIPAEKAGAIKGVMTPQALESRVKAELAELELQSMQEQQDAERKIAALRESAEREMGIRPGSHAVTEVA